MTNIADSKAGTSTEIVLYPDDRLRWECEPVECFDSSLSDVGAILLASVRQSGGLAVAGPQIDVQAALFAYVAPDGTEGVVVNPELVAKSDDLWSYKEGCLSIPNHFWWVSRPRMVTLQYWDLDGKKQAWTASELMGRMIQHEVDHLQGRLIVDLLGKHERKMLSRELGVRLS